MNLPIDQVIKLCDTQGKPKHTVKEVYDTLGTKYHDIIKRKETIYVILKDKKYLREAFGIGNQIITGLEQYLLQYNLKISVVAENQHRPYQYAGVPLDKKTPKNREKAYCYTLHPDEWEKYLEIIPTNHPHKAIPIIKEPQLQLKIISETIHPEQKWTITQTGNKMKVEGIVISNRWQKTYREIFHLTHPKLQLDFTEK